MVTLDYYGMTGTGKTLKAAKEDAGEKLRAALKGDYSPVILAHRGNVVLVARSPSGWDFRTICDADTGPRPGTVHLCGSNYDTQEGALRDAAAHLAQMGWVVADGTESPEFIRDREQRANFERWATFQLRYAKAKATGCTDHESHCYGCGALGRPDLVTRVEGEPSRSI